MIKYFLVNFEIGQRYMPVQVCGKSGKRYGAAIFRKEWGGHVLELTQEQYEGAWQKDAGTWAKPARDINGTKHLALSKWVVFAEAVADLESNEGELAAALDAATTELEKVKLERDAYLADLELLRNLAAPRVDTGLPGPVLTEEPVEPVVEPGTIAIGTPVEPVEELAPNEGTDPRPALEALDFRALRSLAKEEPPIENLSAMKTKDQLVAALISAGRAPRQEAA